MPYRLDIPLTCQNNMNTKETELKKHYPEAALIAAMAESTWAGNLKAAKIEFSLSENLKLKLKELLGREINKIFITDSNKLKITVHSFYNVGNF
jgi:hypothetical protein